MSTPSQAGPGPASIAPLAPLAPPDAPAIPRFTRVEGGFHPQEVRDVFMKMAGEIRHLRGEIARMAERGAHEAVKAAENPTTGRLVADLLQIAAEEAAGERAAATQDAARMIADATTQRDSIISQARSQADEIMSGASTQSATVLEGARTEAKGMLDQASAKATAVELAAGQRQAALEAKHAETMSRLRKVHQVVGGLVDAEDARGSLGDEVAKALPAGVAVASSLPGE